MQYATDLRGICVETGTHDPADFSMLLDAFTYEGCLSDGDEVTADSLPHKLKLVMVGPHIRSSTFNDVALLRIVVDHRTFFEGIANVSIAGKNPDGILRESELVCDKENDG